MTNEHLGKFVRRAALLASTALFSTCAPSSISAPPPMRPVPQGPALAGRQIGMVELSHTAWTSIVDARATWITAGRIAL